MLFLFILLENTINMQITVNKRFGWVPFNHELKKIVQENASSEKFTDEKSIQDGQETMTDMEHQKMQINVANAAEPLTISYTIQYSLPLVTSLTKLLMDRNATRPLTISSDLSQPELQQTKQPASGSIEYDFSSITISKLITTIKELSMKKNRKTKEISISFGQSLRLLNVRLIINLLQACSQKDIILPDIDEIDFNQPFNNTSAADDIRLFSNTFDEDKKSLLISIYLTGYGNQNDYKLLKTFMQKFDVPINIQDHDGDTIIHHMIRKRDLDGVYELLKVLKPNQRFNFEVTNDEGNTILHEMLKQMKNNVNQNFEDKCMDLKRLLDILTSDKGMNLNSFNNAGESLLYLAIDQDVDFLLTAKKTRKPVK